MIDALEAVLGYLESCVDLTGLVGERLAQQDEFGNGNGKWPTATKALVVTYGGGTVNAATGVQMPLLDCRCYGETPREAARVYGALATACRALCRQVVETPEGAGLIYYLSVVSGPTPGWDDNALTDLMVCQLAAAVASQPIA